MSFHHLHCQQFWQSRPSTGADRCPCHDLKFVQPQRDGCPGTWRAWHESPCPPDTPGNRRQRILDEYSLTPSISNKCPNQKAILSKADPGCNPGGQSNMRILPKGRATQTTLHPSMQPRRLCLAPRLKSRIQKAEDSRLESCALQIYRSGHAPSRKSFVTHRYEPYTLPSRDRRTLQYMSFNDSSETD